MTPTYAYFAPVDVKAGDTIYCAIVVTATNPEPSKEQPLRLFAPGGYGPKAHLPAAPNTKEQHQ